MPTSARVGAGEVCASDALVTIADDAGPGSLRQAVADLCPEGTITFAERLDIALASQIVIDKTLTIDGSSVADATLGADDALPSINGGAKHRSFLVATTGDLNLRRVRISNGAVDNLGGGVRNEGRLAVFESRFDGNSSEPSGGLGGGAIYNNGNATLLVDGSTFDHNDSVRGAAIFNSGTAELRNSTFTDNNGETNEGAIQNRGTLVAIHITVANNGHEDASFGGLFAFNADTTLINSIIADNSGNNCFLSGGTGAAFGLLAESGNCAPQLFDDPKLEPIASRGGVTQVRPIRSDSIAVDAGDPEFCLLTDQRGVTRPQQAGCDLGAFEVLPYAFSDGFEGEGAAPLEPAL